jgi:opacity protein-like surface antigen
MKKNAFFIAVCSMLLFSFSAIGICAEGSYVSLNIGLSKMRDSDVTFSGMENKTFHFESVKGLAYGAAIGYGFSNNFRMEGEIAYQKNDLDKTNAKDGDIELYGNSSSTTLLLNGYYDFKNRSAFTPFIGGGIGLATVKVNNFKCDSRNIDDKDGAPAFQATAGIGYALTRQVTLNLKYRYFWTSDLTFDDAKATYSSNNITAGIRVAF